ncbi:MAG: tRNA uridine-5-carboxymethylaminomethyl(34) synthesis GTPase MnmE, partial [Lysobacterales bacterium]
MNDANDTIAAIATASGGGVGIVRISGVAALDIAKRILGHAATSRHAHFTGFRDARGRLIDRGLLLTFVAPASFTGEHVVELHAHGNAVVLETLLARICELGARRARAGEFSERAFLGGKLDLAQAEAIADLIAAGSERQARAAMRSLDGAFSREINALLAALTRLRTHIEAAIDFTDEELDFLGDPALLAQLDSLRTRLAELLRGARRGQQLRDGLYVVITGAPNVGKSSLLNALARSDRAIVTATPGTTRDVLRETVTLGGARIELVDTAGLRDTLDPIEAEGVRRAHAERARADLVLEVVDAGTRHAIPPDEPGLILLPACGEKVPGGWMRGSEQLGSPSSAFGTFSPLSRGEGESNATSNVPDSLRAAGSGSSSPRRIIVHNKIDLVDMEPRIEQHDGVAHTWLSAHDGRGVATLETLLAEIAGGGSHDARGTFSARTRHVDALQRTQTHLDRSREQLVE